MEKSDLEPSQISTSVDLTQIPGFIYGTLQDRVEFSIDPMNELRITCIELLSLDIDQHEVAVRTMNNFHELSTETETARLLRHRNNLKRGLVMVPSGDNETNWINIDESLIGAFSLILNGVEEQISESTPREFAFTGDDRAPFIAEFDPDVDHIMNDEKLAEIAVANYLMFTIDPLLTSLMGSLPEMGEKAENWLKLGGISLRQVIDTSRYGLVNALFGDENHPTIKSISRKTSKIVNALKDFIANPVYTLVEGTTSQLIGSVENEIERNLDNYVADKNAKLLEVTLQPKKKKVRPTKEVDAKPKDNARILEGSSAILVPNKELVREEAKWETVCNTSLNLPWLNESGLKAEVSELSDFGSSVYIVDAISPSLRQVSKDSRSKFTDSINPFDQAISQQAKRMAAGILPWISMNSIKRLTTPKKGPVEYRGYNIWYTFDVRPNAPRVYFTVRTLGEIAAGELPDSLDPDKFSLVVIAETDKDNQPTVLRNLTGLK